MLTEEEHRVLQENLTAAMWASRVDRSICHYWHLRERAVLSCKSVVHSFYHDGKWLDFWEPSLAEQEYQELQERLSRKMAGEHQDLRGRRDHGIWEEAVRDCKDVVEAFFRSFRR